MYLRSELATRLFYRILGNRIDQTEAHSVCGIDLFRDDEHRERLWFADKTRKPLRSSPACNKSQSCATMPKYRVRCCNAPTTSERQVQPTAHAVPGNRGVHRYGEGCNGFNQLLARPGKFISGRSGECGNFFQFRSGREEFGVSCDDQASTDMPQPTQSIPERHDAGISQAIGPIVRAEPQYGCILIRLNLNRGLRHGSGHGELRCSALAKPYHVL